MPYEDSSFDAAYLVTVPGEIPDQAVALRDRAAEAGLEAERMVGGRLWHFTACGPPDTAYLACVMPRRKMGELPGV
jgi:hypothetical protein